MNSVLLLRLTVVLVVVVVVHGRFLYHDHSVLKVHFQQIDHQDDDVNRFVELCKGIDADIWFMNRHFAHVMVNDTQKLKITSDYHTTVHIENVQSEIDSSNQQEQQQQQQQQQDDDDDDDIFSSFPTYGNVLKWMSSQADTHKDVASLFVLGTTVNDIDIVGMKLGLDPTKPIFYLHCTIHAREWITTTTCLWIIDNLLNTNDRNFLSLFQWVIVPVLNVDGYDYTHTTNRLWRKNLQQNSGSSCLGIDLNRNYAYGFGGGGSSSNPCSDTYRGQNAFSAPETLAEQHYLETVFTSVAAYVDIHAYGGLFMSPWGYTTQLPPDYDKMLTAMEEVTEAIKAVNGRSYEYGSSARVIYVAAGGSDDNSYGNGGVIYSYTVEAYGSSFTPPVSEIKPVAREIYAGVKQLALHITQ